YCTHGPPVVAITHSRLTSRRSICRHRGSVFPQTYAGLVAGLASTCLSTSRPSIASPASPRRIISAEWFDAAPSIPPAREIFHNGDVMGSPPSGPPVQRDVKFPIGAGVLDGTLAVPRGARGLVVFAHGSGSSRLSPRNRFVAERLQNAGLATLLTDLLTVPEEDRKSTRLNSSHQIISYAVFCLRR